MITSRSQAPSDRILWILANNGRKFKRTRLRQRMAMKYVDIDPVLADLAREGKVKITEEMISLL